MAASSTWSLAWEKVRSRGSTGLRLSEFAQISEGSMAISSTWSLAWEKSQESSSHHHLVLVSLPTFLLLSQHILFLEFFRAIAQNLPFWCLHTNAHVEPRKICQLGVQRAGCNGVRGYRCVRDRRLSVDASLHTRIFTPHLPLVMTSVLSICKLWYRGERNSATYETNGIRMQSLRHVMICVSRHP